ncbi:MAG: ASKHA domain-containing protein [Promethearchaeia archaeon]
MKTTNAAGDGAKRLLLSTDERRKAERFAQRVKYIELAKHQDFTENFTGAISL